MPRQRLGVVLQVPQPLATELNGLRRALGDPMLHRVVPHVTLVPPVNVHDRDLTTALSVLRQAAASVDPIVLRLGPGATFHPLDPVVYLAVTGDLEGFERLRSTVLEPPLRRTVHDPWVPHVTVSANVATERIPAALEVLSGFDHEVRFDRVHLLREGEGRVWGPIADASLGTAPPVIGRGGLAVEVSATGRPDPEAEALLAIESVAPGSPFAVTARHQQVVVGAGRGWTVGARLELTELVVTAEHRGLGIGRHLVAAVEDLARRRGCTAAGSAGPAEGPPAALLAGSGWRVAGAVDDLGWCRWERVLR
jgi:2'-5' RNA ligase/GNAT superfamily N-acetyltransferase